jgi:hypothetical protein
MVKMTAEESSFEMIPEGDIVAAKVVSIEKKVFDWGDRLNWKFEVTESGPFEEYKINGSTSLKFTIDPPAKFYEWSVQLLARTFDIGDSVDTDDLIGLPCRIEIDYQPDKDDDKKNWMRAGTVIGPRGPSGVTSEDVFG